MSSSTLSPPHHRTATATTAHNASALDRYVVGESVLFTSARHTLLTQGRQMLLQGDLATLPERVAATLASDAVMADSIAAGAIAFDGTAAYLSVPAIVDWSDPLPAGRTRRSQTRQTAWQITPVPAPQDYLAAVRAALERIADGALTKVVLARALELLAERPIEVRELLHQLAGRGRHVFAAPVQGRTLIGASPELLVSRHGHIVTAHPLAGSAARSADPITDRQRAHELLRSVKNRHEHRVVVDAVADALQPHCSQLHVPYEPTLVATPTMWHLGTQISGRVRELSTSSLALAAALHPTPAICGTPTEQARAAIADLEPFGRGLYAGMVGWTDAGGDGEWAVTIRCAEVSDRSVRLVAGAGIVAGSDPEHELAETSAKFRTMLQALDVSAIV
ncbi:isochorismate synthase [Streptosporangium canum]|uniref:isochorismate synthase n=1 Tax=Streptosporangium canum TaxID=324952 RepID=UPI0036A516E0